MLSGIENLKCANKFFKEQGIPPEQSRRLAWNAIRLRAKHPNLQMPDSTIQQHFNSIYQHDQQYPPREKPTFYERHHLIISFARKGKK